MHENFKLHIKNIINGGEEFGSVENC
jgi:hypothetical protein